ncbi:uncharacterized protein LOC131419738 [Diceros bicornis minor]|uniref:uncharacterized protein LOC131419738 n=1 Tax=Diceros bicornis minor TaxID=77932 RepID=UPI0026EE38AC|nr:uncharacterized protein LOC131419738 [Diceros bicornis minor]
MRPGGLRGQYGLRPQRDTGSAWSSQQGPASRLWGLVLHLWHGAALQPEPRPQPQEPLLGGHVPQALFGTEPRGEASCSLPLAPVKNVGAGLVVAVLIANSLNDGITLYRSFLQLGAGLSVGLSGLAAGFAIGIVGDARVQGTAQQPQLFVGMILILIFAEVLGLYGLIVALILSTK